VLLPAETFTLFFVLIRLLISYSSFKTKRPTAEQITEQNPYCGLLRRPINDQNVQLVHCKVNIPDISLVDKNQRKNLWKKYKGVIHHGQGEIRNRPTAGVGYKQCATTVQWKRQIDLWLYRGNCCRPITADATLPRRYWLQPLPSHAIIYG